jgi:hypothetical protein
LDEALDEDENETLRAVLAAASSVSLAKRQVTEAGEENARRKKRRKESASDCVHPQTPCRKARLTKSGRSSIESVVGGHRKGKGAVGSGGVGDAGGHGHVVLLGDDDEVGSTVGGDGASVVVELVRETDDQVRVLGVKAARASVAIFCESRRG